MSEDPIGFGGGSIVFSEFVGNDPISYIDPSGLTRVEVRYRPLPGILGALGYYHAFIVVIDNNGQIWYYSSYAESKDGDNSSSSGSSVGSSASLTSSSGGSSSGSSSGANASSASTSSNSSNSSSPGSSPAKPGGSTGLWGQLNTEHGPYRPGTFDWTTDTLPSTVVVDDPNLPSQPILDKLNALTNNVQNNTIPYNPLGPNSNSFSHQLPQDLGYPRPTPPEDVIAPGHDVKIPTGPNGTQSLRNPVRGAVSIQLPT